MPITPDTTLLNKYRIVRLLGEGGMERVSQARARELDYQG